jgi:protein involved in polysaccharide export with SLBB domain
MKRVFIILLLLCAASASWAQLTSPGGGTSSAQPPAIMPSLSEKAAPSISPDALIFDGAVNATEYRLGPGDILQYRSWTSNDVQQLMISTDEVLTIPRIGAFMTKGKTLAQLRVEVEQVVDKNFSQKAAEKGLFALTLTQPRRIMVTVLGEVETPGVYACTGATRAAIAVAIANKPLQRATILSDQVFQQEQERRKREAERLKPYFGDGSDQSASTRNIIVSHSDGTTERLDLFRFNGTHDPRFSPLLREGDVLYVPYKKLTEGVVGIYGSVKSPGEYEFVQGDSLWALIRAAFGPTDGADLSKIELVRMNEAGSQSTTQTVDGNALRLGTASDIALQSGDRVFIRNRSDIREVSRVIVKGEVSNPGVYPITRNSTHLSDIIKQAGGFTPYAFVAGGTIIRKKLDIDNKDITTEDERKLVGRVANLDVEDTATFRFLTETREGYVAADMQKLFEKNDASADVILQDGDVVSIPSQPNTVYVWGYVGSVGYIPYHEGWSANDYINAAGGYAEGAVIKNTRVIKVRSRRWAKPTETTVEPGDEIYVPKEKLYPDDYSLRQTATYVGIAGAIIGAIATIVTLYVVYTNSKK